MLGTVLVTLEDSNSNQNGDQTPGTITVPQGEDGIELRFGPVISTKGKSKSKG